MRFVHGHLLLAAVVTAIAGCGSDSGAGARSDSDGGSSSGAKSGASTGAAGNATGGKGAGRGGRGQGGSGAAGDGGGTADGGSGMDAGPGAGGDSSGGAGGAGDGGAAGMGTGGGLGGGTFVTPGDPGASDVQFSIDSSGTTHPISPYVYGTNQGNFNTEAKGLTLARVGGNRLTAYNWENNASNAGSDYMYESDTNISSSKVAGDPMKKSVQSAANAGASIIMTVPIAGWVSADTNGPAPANPTPAQIAERFFPIIAQKGSAFAYPPDTTDKKVYADEFVSWLESQFPNAQTDPARRIFYMLDNEPDLWSSTHSEIHPDPVTYAELAQKCTDFATGIKAVAPKALVFGPANYGWGGFTSLQNAPDAGGRDFINFFLDSMKAAEAKAGKRLLDVLDVHWYPEATGGGNRIIDDGTAAAEVTARLQAPRSLWDPKYSESSWIVQSGSGPIQLIPRVMKQISAHYPGTKFSISEYNYGAGGHISGGIAQADVLGVFGREGLFAATMWELSGNNSYIFGGFAMFRNYDGAGGVFGDISIPATNSAADKSSVYASVASANPMNVIVVAINKQSAAVKAGITIKHNAALNAADVYTLTSAGAKPVKGAALAKVATNAFNYSMPAYSVSTLVFHP